jgi:hypothetical protein
MREVDQRYILGEIDWTEYNRIQREWWSRFERQTLEEIHVSIDRDFRGEEREMEIIQSEGLPVTAEMLEIDRRYIAGEIDGAERSWLSRIPHV